MQSIAAVLKANPYRDAAGRWTSKDKARAPASFETDMEKQAKWLKERAQELGHPDVDSLLRADVPAFLKLTQHWRRTHTFKANPYKDAAGRWTSKDKAVAPGHRKEQYTPEQKAQLRDLMARSKKMPPGIRADAKLEGDPVPLKNLTDYLTIVGRSGGKVEAFVMTHGEEFKVPDTPPPIKLMTPKECFSNSARQSTAMGGKLGYAEGWVYPQGLIPIEHAWNYDLKTGEVIDHTMGWNPKSAYFGVKIPDRKLRKQLATSGVYGAFRSGWRESDLIKNWDAK